MKNVKQSSSLVHFIELDPFRNTWRAISRATIAKGQAKVANFKGGCSNWHYSWNRGGRALDAAFTSNEGKGQCTKAGLGRDPTGERGCLLYCKGGRQSSLIMAMWLTNIQGQSLLLKKKIAKPMIS